MAAGMAEIDCCGSQQRSGGASSAPGCVSTWEGGRGSEEAILLQVGTLGKNYKAWVHQPVKGRPRFFQSTLLECITKTPWWLVPVLWGPVLACCLAVSLVRGPLGLSQTLALVAAGGLIWQLMEYVIHRWVFHQIPESYWGITAHFLFHGCHHKYPMDASRLVFPPLPAAAVALTVFGVLQSTTPQEAVLPLFTGIAAGYLTYDCMHYGMHHSSARGWLAPLRRAHLHHHFRAPDAGFGISSPLFDALLCSAPSGGVSVRG